MSSSALPAKLLGSTLQSAKLLGSAHNLQQPSLKGKEKVPSQQELVEQAAEDEKKKERTERTKSMLLKAVYANIFQAVVQHVLCLQSEQHLFIKAHGGDVAGATRTLSLTTALVGALGLQANQIGGRLSDAYGRRPFFLLGPVVNFIVGLLVFKMPGSKLVLAATRILKMLSTTFSGSVMISAALGDMLSGTEGAVAGAKIASFVGIGLTVGPFLESAVLRLSRGAHRAAYLGLAVVAAAQFATTASLMPETLSKPVTFDFQKTLEALNPFDAFRIFTSKSRTLKRLVGVWMLQLILEGKNISDFSMIWMREHVKWSPQAIRNHIAFYGAMTTLAGLLFTPTVLMRTKAITFTTLANIGMAIGFTPCLFTTSGTAVVVSLFPQLLGINGASNSALAPLMMRCANEAGFGQGQYAAYMNNLRAVPSILSPLFVGALYDFLKRRGYYAGVVYPTMGFFGAVLPTVLLWTGVDRCMLEG